MIFYLIKGWTEDMFSKMKCCILVYLFCCLFLRIHGRDAFKSLKFRPSDAFNPALERSVVVNPASSTCGYNQLDSVFYRLETLKCTTKCEREYPVLHSKDFLVKGVVSLGQPGCKEPSSQGQPQQQYDNPCYIEKPSSINMSNNETYSLWIKPELGNKTGTIFSRDSLSYVITNENLKIYTTAPDQLLNPSTTWTVPNDYWTHLAIQMDSSFNEIRVFLNGTFMRPVLQIYQPQRRKRALGSDYFRIGVPPDNNITMFKGQMEDFFWTNVSLTNREMVALYTEKLPVVYPETNCLCSAETPFIKSLDPLYCADSDGQKVAMLTSRFIQNSSLIYNSPEFVNDDEADTSMSAWLSTPGIEDVDVSIDFEKEVLLLAVHLRPLTDIPAKYIAILSKRKSGWKAMHYLSRNCWQLPPSLRTDPDIRCKNVTTSLFVEFDSLLGRMHGDYLTVKLRQFLTSRGIRIKLVGLPYNVTGTRGNAEKYHAIQDISVLAIAPLKCNCYPGGTIANTSCDDSGQCPCNTTNGNLQLSGKECEPYIDRAVPLYGPEAGGTNIFFLGGFLGNSTQDLSVVANYEVVFNVSAHNQTLIHVVTPPANQTRVDLPIEIRLSSGYILQPGNFTYKSNPVITEIEPRHTFFKGGISQTIIGQHLDSVALPFMEITMLYLGSFVKALGRSICDVHNETMMTCPSPPINIPDTLPQRRRRRTDPVSFINSDYRQFYIGIYLDGLETYNNVSRVLPEYGIMRVYDDPEIYEFDRDGESEVKTFRTYSPHNDEFLIIKGERMNYGCEMQDYEVHLGLGYCTMVVLNTNQLTCRPPQTPPDLGQIHKKGAHRVTVKVGNMHVVVGYLQYELSIADRSGFIGGLVGGILGLLIIIGAIVGFLIWRKKQKFRHLKHRGEQTRLGSLPENRYSLLNDHRLAILEALPADLRIKIDECLIHSDRMRLDEEIGKGNFGKVYKGLLYPEGDQTKGDVVAIKTVKDYNVSSTVIEEFLEEGMIMKDFQHDHVLSLLGVVIARRPYVLLPYMSCGDLKSFVKNPKNTLRVSQLVTFALHIAKGMSYLESQHFVHRDLAARNCMIDEDYCVKIADFGLARDIYDKDYYRVEDKQRPLPVKWMAIESLENHKFSSKSDVWAYGVVLWEILKRGVKPYPDVDNFQLKDYLRRGGRLEKPDYAPDCVYDMMCRCWESSPEKRPDFKQCAEILENLLNESESNSPSYQDVQNSPPSYLELIGESATLDDETKHPVVEQDIQYQNLGTLVPCIWADDNDISVSIGNGSEPVVSYVNAESPQGAEATPTSVKRTSSAEENRPVDYMNTPRPSLVTEDILVATGSCPPDANDIVEQPDSQSGYLAPSPRPSLTPEYENQESIAKHVKSQSLKAATHSVELRQENGSNRTENKNYSNV